jgi:hypothetical protein
MESANRRRGNKREKIDNHSKTNKFDNILTVRMFVIFVKQWACYNFISCRVERLGNTGGNSQTLP